MIIGVPKEIKNNEFRVAITAAGVHEFRTHGHTVLVDRGYVRPVNGIKPPNFDAPPTGEVTLIGLARPNESNPGPRLALVAGTTTVTASVRKATRTPYPAGTPLLRAPPPVADDSGVMSDELSDITMRAGGVKLLG